MGGLKVPKAVSWLGWTKMGRANARRVPLFATIKRRKRSTGHVEGGRVGAVGCRGFRLLGYIYRPIRPPLVKIHRLTILLSSSNKINVWSSNMFFEIVILLCIIFCAIYQLATRPKNFPPGKNTLCDNFLVLIIHKRWLSQHSNDAFKNAASVTWKWRVSNFRFLCNDHSLVKVFISIFSKLETIAVGLTDGFLKCHLVRSVTKLTNWEDDWSVGQVAVDEWARHWVVDRDRLTSRCFNVQKSGHLFIGPSVTATGWYRSWWVGNLGVATSYRPTRLLPPYPPICVPPIGWPHCSTRSPWDGAAGQAHSRPMGISDTHTTVATSTDRNGFQSRIAPHCSYRTCSLGLPLVVYF